MLTNMRCDASGTGLELAERLSDDTGSVIEEMGWKGLMIAAALAAGTTVAAVVAMWAGAIPTP